MLSVRLCRMHGLLKTSPHLAVRVYLHAAAAIAFYAVARAANDQQVLRIQRAIASHVHRQVFTFPAIEGVDVGLNRQASYGRCF